MIVTADGTVYSGAFRPGMSEARIPGPYNPPQLDYIIKTTPAGESQVVV